MTAAPPTSMPTPFGPLELKRRPLLVAGAGMVLLGLAAPVFPLATVVVGFAAGWLLWLGGAVMLGFSLLLAPGRLRLVSIFASLFITAAGVLLTFRPTLGALATAVLLAAAFIIDGSVQTALALRLRPLGAWRVMLASAFASLVAGALLATGWPERSPETVGLLLGLAFVTTGAGFLAVGLSRPPAGA